MSRRSQANAVDSIGTAILGVHDTATVLALAEHVLALARGVLGAAGSTAGVGEGAGSLDELALGLAASRALAELPGVSSALRARARRGLHGRRGGEGSSLGLGGGLSGRGDVGAGLEALRAILAEISLLTGELEAANATLERNFAGHLHMGQDVNVSNG